MEYRCIQFVCLGMYAEGASVDVPVAWLFRKVDDLFKTPGVYVITEDTVIGKPAVRSAAPVERVGD